MIQIIAMQLMIAGLSLLVQIGDCQTDQCIQGRNLAIQAISISKDIQEGRIVISEPVQNTQTTQTTGNTDSTNNTNSTETQATQTAQTTQTTQTTPSPEISTPEPVIPIAYVTEPSYTITGYIPPVYVDSNDDGIPDAGGAMNVPPQTTYKLGFSMSKPVNGEIVIYIGGHIVDHLKYKFSNSSDISYTVTNNTAQQMSYVIFIEGLGHTERKNIAPRAL